MQQSIRMYLTHYTEETLMITLMVLLAIITILIVYWIHNRRKYRELTHQIPASVVKSYLDSIIQNSTSLKSSLFRGGGLDIGEGIPSVVPAKDFPSSGVELSGASLEELNQKNAEIASLNSRLGDKEKIVLELESKMKNMRAQLDASGDDASIELQKQLDVAHARIAELEAQLAQQPEAGGGDSEAKLADITKERDELKERLAEYEIIEDDIANLKKYKQENEQLKKSLAAFEGGGAPAPAEAEAAPPAPAAEPAPDLEPAEELPAADGDLEAQMAAAIEETPAGDDDLEAQMAAAIEETPAGDDDLEAQMAAAIEETPTEEPAAEAAPAQEEVGVPDEGNAEQKSAEELLGEFEKMLG